MRWSKAFITTLREDPAECEVPSHTLMVRAGLINKLMAGAYSYLPLGLRVLQKITAIIREEMNAAGAEEVLLPAIQPLELWQKTGRDRVLNDIFMKYENPSGGVVIFGPTHEEVITDLVAKCVKSYRQLPVILYQIQTKFRDEPRPRFGIIRSREFIMKDAYSFDADPEGLEKSYRAMYDAYCAIFTRCGLPYTVVEADSGAMGGDASHEFMVISESGEDAVALCTRCGYAANLERAEARPPSGGPGKKAATEPRHDAPKTKEKIRAEELTEVATPGKSTVEEVSVLLGVTPDKLIKTLIYEISGESVAVLIRGDHQLNEVKLARFFKTADIQMAGEETIRKVTGAPVGFAGPVGLPVRIVADYALEKEGAFVTGANKQDAHLVNAVRGRDFTVSEFGDFRYVIGGDPCPRCDAVLVLENAIEIGHIFKLGTKYSAALGAAFLDKDGKERTAIMGCYGIGVNRIIAAAIEAHHDGDGIFWPLAIAPYQVVVQPLKHSEPAVRDGAERLYNALKEKGIEVLLDDRDVRPGIKFKDAELIGIPLRMVLGNAFTESGTVEIQTRIEKKREYTTEAEAVKMVQYFLDTSVFL